MLHPSGMSASRIHALDPSHDLFFPTEKPFCKSREGRILSYVRYSTPSSSKVPVLRTIISPLHKEKPKDPRPRRIRKRGHRKNKRAIYCLDQEGPDGAASPSGRSLADSEADVTGLDARSSG